MNIQTILATAIACGIFAGLMMFVWWTLLPSPCPCPQRGDWWISENTDHYPMALAYSDPKLGSGKLVHVREVK